MNTVYPEFADGKTGQAYINKFSGNRSETSSTERINNRGFNFYGIINGADKYQYGYSGTQNKSETTAYSKVVPVVRYEKLEFSSQKKYFQNSNSSSSVFI